MIYFAAVWLSSKYRRFHHHWTHPLPVQALQQRHQLGVVELHPDRPDPRPAERRLLEPLGKEADPAPILPDNLDPVRPLRPEHVKRPAERISTPIRWHGWMNCA